MNYSTDAPFNSYQEIRNAIKSNNVSISWKRATAYDVACYINKILAFSLLMIPLFSMIAILIGCHILEISKFMAIISLVSLPINLFFANRLNNLLAFIALLCIILPIWVIESTFWLVPIGAGIIGMIVGEYIWWGIISGTATKAIMSDESLFEDLWSRRGFALRGRNKYHGFYLFGIGAFSDDQ